MPYSLCNVFASGLSNLSAANVTAGVLQQSNGGTGVTTGLSNLSAANVTSGALGVAYGGTGSTTTTGVLGSANVLANGPTLTGSATAVNLAVSGALYCASNVGVGTSNSGYPLEVSSSTTPYLGITSRSAGQNANLVLNTPSGTSTIYRDANNRINFQNSTAPATVALTCSNASVGICTQTPAYPLDVNGIIHNNTYVACGSTTINNGYRNDSNYPGLFIGAAGGQNAVVVGDVSGAAGFTMGIDGSDNKLKLQVGGGLGTGLFTNPGVTVDAAGTMTVTGNLRVGTWSNSTNMLVFAGTPGDTSPDPVNAFSFLANRSFDPAGGASPASDSSELLLAQFNDPNDRLRYVSGCHKFQVYDATLANIVPGAAQYADSNFKTALTIGSNRYVGIGFDGTPLFPLHVRGYAVATDANVGAKSYVYMTNTTTVVGQISNGAGVGNGNGTVASAGGWSANFERAVLATEFNAYSDARIKADVRPALACGDALGALRPVTFRYKDAVAHAGGGRKLGFIAQEVEAVVPEVVRTARDFVPDVYRPAAADGDVVRLEAHGLAAGDVLRIAVAAAGTADAADAAGAAPSADDHIVVATVLEVLDEDAFRVDGALQHEAVFVIGRRVDDLRTLDSDQLLALTVGAVQDLQAEVAQLREEVRAALRSSGPASSCSS